MVPVVVTMFNLMFAMFLNNRHSHVNALSYEPAAFAQRQQQQQAQDTVTPFEL